MNAKSPQQTQFNDEIHRGIDRNRAVTLYSIDYVNVQSYKCSLVKWQLPCKDTKKRFNSETMFSCYINHCTSLSRLETLLSEHLLKCMLLRCLLLSVMNKINYNSRGNRCLFISQCYFGFHYIEHCFCSPSPHSSLIHFRTKIRGMLRKYSPLGKSSSGTCKFSYVTDSMNLGLFKIYYSSFMLYTENRQ